MNKHRLQSLLGVAGGAFIYLGRSEKAMVKEEKNDNI